MTFGLVQGDIAAGEWSWGGQAGRILLVAILEKVR
jgi:hypothetical protein